MGNSAHVGDVDICRYLCARGFVVVTVNYRLGQEKKKRDDLMMRSNLSHTNFLGLFGFLTTNDKHASGNYGRKRK